MANKDIEKDIKQPISEYDQTTKKIIHYAILGVILLFVLIILFGSFYTVGAGERGIILTFGKPDLTSIPSGLHFKIPIVQSVVIMNVQTQKYVVEKASASSSDLQIVTTDITVNYFINPESVPTIYTNLGTDYQDTIINPAVLETIKQVTAKYTAEQLITERPAVKDDIDTALTSRLKAFNVNVQAVSITNFDFSSQFNVAIENKVTAIQNADTEKNNLAKVQYEAQQRVAQAQGEADAIKIQAQAIQQQGGSDYIRLQAINKWNGVLPTVTSGAIPFLNIGATGNNTI